MLRVERICTSVFVFLWYNYFGAAQWNADKTDRFEVAKMIEHGLKIEMGDGDVLISCAVYDGKGVLFFREKESGRIGNVEKGESELSVEEIERSPLVLSFRNRASILAMKVALDKLFRELE